MKNIKLKWFAAFVAISAFLLAGSCKKDRVPVDDYQDMESFYDDNQEEEQELQVDSGSSGSCFVTAQKGTRICMTRDMIRDASGNDIPSYPFQLKVIELYSIKDMILRRQPSVSGSVILETTAEVKVRPFKDGSEAFLKDGRAYLMETGTIDSIYSGMQAFYGFENGGVNDWTSDLASFIPGFVDTLSSVAAASTYYVLTPAKTGYVSAAQGHQSSAATTPITISVTGTNTQNLQIYLSFNSFKGVIRITNLVSIPVPVGESVTLVAFGKKQTNEYVLHKQTFNVGAGHQITLALQVLSESNLLAALETL